MAPKKETNVQLFNNAEQLTYKFRTQFNGSHKPYKETSTQPSQTVPGLDMSISEMLRRTSLGLPIASNATPIYNGERLLPKWKDLDLIDRAQVRKDAQQSIIDLREKYKNIQKRNAERAAAAATEAAKQQIINDKFKQYSEATKAEGSASNNKAD